MLVSLAWVLFRSPTFAVASNVYRELFTGGSGVSMLTGWPAVLGCGIVAFGILRLLLERRGITIAWPQLRPLTQIGALAGLLVALQLLTWAGPSPTFIYFKF